jgi:hypothetical protein
MISLAKPTRSKKRKQSASSTAKPIRKQKIKHLSDESLPEVEFSYLLRNLSAVFSRLSLQLVLVTRVFHPY